MINTFQVSFLALLHGGKVHDGRHQDLVDDGREEKVEEHGGGADPASPPKSVKRVEGNGEGNDDEVGEDLPIRVAHEVDVGGHPLVGVVQRLVGDVHLVETGWKFS